MHNQFNTTSFNTAKTGVRNVVSAALAGLFSIGMLSVVVTGMADQSGGQSLGQFVAAQQAQPLHNAVATAASTPSAF